MAHKVISISESFKDYIEYVHRYKQYPYQYEKQMEIFFHMLEDDITKAGVSDLNRKADRLDLEKCAKYLVLCSRKDSGALKAKKIERAKFYNGYVDYVTDSTQYKKGNIKMGKLPFVMSDLERKLDYVKHYREYSTKSKKELGDMYYVDERTIRNDDREIRDGYLNAFGQTIDIGYDQEKRELFSTPVPLFLVQNITQIVVILNGLGALHKDHRYKCYAESTAMNIWLQLTREVKDRIVNDLIDIMHLDREWYEFLDEERSVYKLKNYTERMIASNKNNIMMFWKNGLLCDVFYSMQDQTIRLYKVAISECRETYFKVHGHDVCIPYKDLIDINETGN